ncbi:peptidase T [Serratia sp. M24T3]|uniref:peptidase T n=1 Tax=Serratia sp. M24T3 TaxID=932213 RepID=UPI00025B8E16|nr:peptidase T [Serratia sp. M24T3]EIC85377.1 peptidase T [Serratia sp. M24T3]
MDMLLERFLHYLTFDTQSKVNAKSTPSSDGQTRLAYSLRDELISLGFDAVTLSPKGCVMATLATNVSWPVPTLGFIAHLDTSPDFSGKNVNPQIIENYRGGDVALGQGEEYLSPVMFPVMHQLLGQTLITTDGKSLLGADDKAGIAEIITAMQRLKNSNLPHGTLRMAFTPDEEIGKGAQNFDVEQFAADWAYTVDGGGLGELEFENFNAASATIKIVGNSVHPGSAKGVMVNALSLAMRFHLALPDDQTPETTSDYQGFYHLTSVKGTVERAEMHYIVRDFDHAGFSSRKQKMVEVAEWVGKGLHPDCYIEVTLDDHYYNMRDEILKHPHTIELAKRAMTDCNIKPVIRPIRGGTDGAQLSFRGLPCPNIFTGGYNFHGKHEFITLQGMESAVEVIMRLAQLVAEDHR